MSTTTKGREAETRVAEYLKKRGYKLLDQNWRTRYCEIDLVMSKNGTVYFVEVKYRSSDTYGSGLEYITPKKLKQMQYAAEVWITAYHWVGDATLMGAQVSEGSEQVLLVDDLVL